MSFLSARWIALVVVTSLISGATGARSFVSRVAAAERYHSDSNARFLHHIDLYDVDNRKITPTSTRPFSPLNTCGRCHDYETISHGWHFNAFSVGSTTGPTVGDSKAEKEVSKDDISKDGVAQRVSEPWIWTDPKTGTQLPLSYRPSGQTYDPRAVGLTAWEMTKQFGGRIPGGNMGESMGQASDDQAPDQHADSTPAEDSQSEDSQSEDSRTDGESQQESPPSRWPLSGALEVDCMVCHAVSGAYDFNARRTQVAEENFAWAPSAGLRLATIDGRVDRIKEGSDPADESTLKKIPKATYDASRFGVDGKVFMDLVRQPQSNACFQCHSSRTVGRDGIDARWSHDEDVHLRAGMDCVDCHRNGIDHHIVRGFSGEQNPSGANVETLSCSGCHLGAESEDSEIPTNVLARAGRLGSPKPAHAGLPPVHFEKLSCTACHGGPVPRDEAVRIMTSLAHGLGEKGHRSGVELPAIVGPVYTSGSDGRVGPHRAMWPAFWGRLADGIIEPLSPPQVYDWTRKSLRVRKDFVQELLKPKMSSSDLKKLLGDERAKVDSADWTDDERAKVDAAQAKEGRAAFESKVAAALAAIENELASDASQGPGSSSGSSSGSAVYVSSGFVYARGEKEGTLKTIEVEGDRATEMVRWPMAHNVRPAGWSLGVAGCVECHSEDANLFASTVSAVGPGPDRGEAVTMATLQGVDLDQRLDWNELFRGRKSFKYLVAGSIVLLLSTLLVGVGATASRIGRRKT